VTAEAVTPNETVKFCETKRALLRAYQLATLAYTDAVLKLEPMSGTVEGFMLAEDAEAKATAASRELEKHVAEHGC
jgi:hypothetical protein